MLEMASISCKSQSRARWGRIRLSEPNKLLLRKTSSLVIYTPPNFAFRTQPGYPKCSQSDGDTAKGPVSPPQRVPAGEACYCPVWDVGVGLPSSSPGRCALGLRFQDAPLSPPWILNAPGSKGPWLARGGKTWLVARVPGSLTTQTGPWQRGKMCSRGNEEQFLGCLSQWPVCLPPQHCTACRLS